MSLGRYAGPFETIPFKNYIKSPIGLVPKAGNKMRQIFHLSYEFRNGNHSLNYHTPKEKCTVKYNDIDEAIKNSLKMMRKMGATSLHYSKTDATLAFCLLPLSPECCQWLVMKAKDPRTGKTFFFIDKCLPFGASISCSHFQRFSNPLKNIFEFLWKVKIGWEHISVQDRRDIIEFVTNYLDDFLFITISINSCNQMIRCFLQLCETLDVPISKEKTEWGSVRIIFLGMLLDGIKCIITIPEDKRRRAQNMIDLLLSKRKATVKELEKLAGFLNFLNKAIVTGRAFTRCMYTKFITVKGRLKAHHHIMLDKEFKEDCKVWKTFLDEEMENSISRPFIDIDVYQHAHQLRFYTDATANASLGFGCLFDDEWTFKQWEVGFIEEFEPSIEFLELYTLCIGVFTWIRKLYNKRIIVFCDNEAVVTMVNNITSGCKYCMTLIRKLMLLSMKANLRIFT